MNKARIIDIALQAGVSTATVDRVLNNRPGVRQQTQAKVNDAMKLLEMAESRPRIIPTFANSIEIDAIIAGSAGFANDLLAQELRKAGRERGVHLRTAYPRRLNPTALAEAMTACIEQGTSGMIVQTLDHPLVRNVIDDASAQNIPVVSLLTSLPGSRALGYVGLDNRAAGRTSGLLMGLLVREIGDIAVFVGGPLYRSHEEREMGFRTVLRESYPNLTLLPVIQSKDDPDRAYQMATELLSSNKMLRGILNIGGGNRGIEKALLESGRKTDVTYVCYNLTPLTRQALVSGVVDAVVHQDMGKAAHIAIGSIINHLTSQPAEFSHVPVEIIMRENVR